MREKSVAIILAGGAKDKGGIESVTRYSIAQIKRLDPDLSTGLQRSRVGSGILAHASAPFCLLQFVVRRFVWNVGVCHVNVAPRGSTFRKMLFCWAAKATGVRVLLHLHGSGYDAFFRRLPSPMRALVRQFFAMADRVVVLGDYWERFAMSDLQVARERLRVIQNGVPEPAARASAAQDPPVVMFAGLVGQRKGVDVLLRAAAQLKESGARFRLAVYGNGEVEAYRALADQLGLGDAAVFHGWADGAQIDLAMQQADVFVLPSRAENQPVAILEAMAHGLPVISTRVGAIPEQIVDGTTGLLVDPGDVEALATAIGRLLQNPVLRRIMGEAGVKHWRQLYSTEANAAALLQEYRSLLALSANGRAADRERFS